MENDLFIGRYNIFHVFKMNSGEYRRRKVDLFMANAKSPALFYGAIAVAVIALLLCIYYIIPGVNHVLVSGNPTAVHLKHVALFAAITVLGIIAALVTRPKSAAQ